MHVIFKAFPTYCLGSSVFFNQMQKHLAEYRAATDGSGYQLSENPLDMTNTSGDSLGMGLNMIFWFGALLFIEMGLAKKLN